MGGVESYGLCPRPKAPEWWSWDWQSGLYKESDGPCHSHGPEAERLQQLTPPSPR